jgi:valine--pyruvate aminotransferase
MCGRTPRFVEQYMQFEFSLLGRRLTGGSGIQQLMDDLGQALEEGGPHLHMLGGGNPAAIPEITALWRGEMRRLLESDTSRFDRMLLNYDPCRGNSRFVAALARLFNDTYGWGLTEENIVVTNGGQTAFFFLINLLAGRFDANRRKTILFPLMPEYIGYANQSIDSHVLETLEPRIEILDDTTFKYHVEFDRLRITDETAAVCLSRPTNPSGNVLSNAEVSRLRELAAERDIPLIIDNAYGAPFPHMVFEDARPIWGDNVILTYSLSKLGLPGTRTGIVIGPPPITRAICAMNAVVGLANGNVGQVLVTPFLEDGRILSLSREVIRPFYERKSLNAQQWLRESLPRDSYRVHKSEGALFLWLWFPGLPITTRELYQRLKERGVLIIPGEPFFYGVNHAWRHREQCVRLTFSMSDEHVRQGIRIIGEVIAGL